MDMNFIDSMGLTFFCNSMVEELYYMRERNFVSEKLEQNCKKGISGFDSLKWPLNEKSYPNIKNDIFSTIYNIEIFEQICEHYEKSAGQMIEEIIGNLEYIISNKPISKKFQTSEKLQEFFDDFGDYSFYATRDCLRA